jgi:hypothetical protein
MGVKSSAKTCKAIHQTLKNFNSFVANLVPCIKALEGCVEVLLPFSHCSEEKTRGEKRKVKCKLR